MRGLDFLYRNFNFAVSRFFCIFAPKYNAMIDKIKALRAELEAVVADDAAAVEALRIKYLSKKGAISALMNDFRNVDPSQKRELGQALNELKTYATERINTLREAAERGNDKGGDLDLTRTAAPLRIGTRHPLSLVREQIIDIFRRLGFTIAEGPEMKTTGTCSSRSTSLPTTRHATCRIPSLSTAPPTCCCAPTPRRCRPAL